MTQRGRLALVLGGATYLGAWAFGSKVLYPLALGLPAAVLLGWLWTRLANRPLHLRRILPAGERLEGEDVQVRVELAAEQWLVPARWILRERIGKLGERLVPVGAHGRSTYVLEKLRRGRYAFEESVAVVEDPLGFERVEQRLEAPAALLVYPRLVELERLFSESGGRAHDGRRLLLRRPSGFDLHSVRDYEHGDSLRKVHWRSTARRGQLMVKELEDAPRDEVAVVLDADPAAVVGESFDVEVRAAGSLLLAQVRRGRRALLVVNADAQQQRVRSADADWRRALDLLAAVEPKPGPPLAALLSDESSAAGRALELVVVTAALSPRLVERLVERALASGNVSLVLIDAASFGERHFEPVRPELLRLESVGVATVVVRRGDDLAERLGAAPAVEAAPA